MLYNFKPRPRTRFFILKVKKMKISIIGVGLIGGSIALKLKQKKTVDFIYGIDHNKTYLNEAQHLNIIDEQTNLENGIKNSDLIILAIPVDAARKILPQILDLISDSQTVMDVGSTKAGIVDSVKNVLFICLGNVFKDACPYLMDLRGV